MPRLTYSNTQKPSGSVLENNENVIVSNTWKSLLNITWEKRCLFGVPDQVLGLLEKTNFPDRVCFPRQLIRKPAWRASSTKDNSLLHVSRFPFLLNSHILDNPGKKNAILLLEHLCHSHRYTLQMSKVLVTLGHCTRLQWWFQSESDAREITTLV